MKVYYTTQISSKIRGAWGYYQYLQKSYPFHTNEIREAFHLYATACEKENKNHLKVTEHLLNTQA